MDKDDKMLLSSIEDKIEQFHREYRLVRSVFLDPRQRKLAEDLLRGRGLPYVFYGGYEDAERTALLLLPDYLAGEGTGLSGIGLPESGLGEDDPLAVARVSYAKGGRELTHRDFLGSVLSLGVKRERLGDILVHPLGADLIILRDLGEFLSANYCRAGRTELSLEICPVENLKLPEFNIVEKTDTVASLRLDNLLASAYGLSRGKALEALHGGMVFVNNLEATKPDAQLKEGDKLVLRGRGKTVLREVGGRSRKDRIFVRFDVYQ